MTDPHFCYPNPVIPPCKILSPNQGDKLTDELSYIHMYSSPSTVYDWKNQMIFKISGPYIWN